jgi:hypothetical protein
MGQTMLKAESQMGQTIFKRARQNCRKTHNCGEKIS